MEPDYLFMRMIPKRMLFKELRLNHLRRFPHVPPRGHRLVLLLKYQKLNTRRA